MTTWGDNIKETHTAIKINVFRYGGVNEKINLRIIERVFNELIQTPEFRDKLRKSRIEIDDLEIMGDGATYWTTWTETV